MRIKCFPFENSSCMRIKTISLMSSRTISGVQEEFSEGCYTILPFTYCFTGEKDIGETMGHLILSLPNWVR